MHAGPCIHSFKQYLWHTYCVPHSVKVTGDKGMKTKRNTSCWHGTYFPLPASGGRWGWKKDLACISQLAALAKCHRLGGLNPVISHSSWGCRIDLSPPRNMSLIQRGVFVSRVLCLTVISSALADKEDSSRQAQRRPLLAFVTSTSSWLLAQVRPGDGIRFLRPMLSYHRKNCYSLAGFHRTGRCKWREVPGLWKSKNLWRKEQGEGTLESYQQTCQLEWALWPKLGQFARQKKKDGSIF